MKKVEKSIPDRVKTFSLPKNNKSRKLLLLYFPRLYLEWYKVDSKEWPMGLSECNVM